MRVGLILGQIKNSKAMKRRRLSKKKKITKESVPGGPGPSPSESQLPPDLVIEILKRYPVKLVTKCLLVSKLWATIIRSQDFIRAFPFPSPQPQQMPFLFAVSSIAKSGSGNYKWFFYLSSSSLVEEEDHQQVLSPLSLTECQIPHRRLCLSDVHYVNGLISLGYGHQQIINNPSTGKSIYLPKVKSRKQIIQSYFGFDPVECRYKVLCMAERMNDYSNVPSSDHQVITVGGIEKQSWRMIECDTPHCPKTNGVCIDGVLYYGAFTGSDMMEWCVMRFDVNTEKLDLCSRLYEEVVSFRRRHSPSLINYHGKVALSSETSLDTFDLWVMEDAEKWCKVRFSIGGMRQSGDAELCIGGTIHTGEIVLFYIEGGACVTHAVFCDHKENKIRQAVFDMHRQFKLGIDGRPDESLRDVCLVVPFFDYVESVMLL